VQFEIPRFSPKAMLSCLNLFLPVFLINSFYFDLRLPQVEFFRIHFVAVLIHRQVFCVFVL